MFSDTGCGWRSIPPWVAYLINLGVQWPAGDDEPRRIGLISMPCDSAAAGLVAMGVLIRDLQNPRANDLDGHYDGLVRYARQFLKACSICKVRCRPEISGCTYASESTGELRHIDGTKYKVSGIAESRHDGLDGIVCSSLGVRRPERRWVLPGNSAQWHIEGEPALTSGGAGATLDETPYAALSNGVRFPSGSLGNSFSGLCLVGRLAGGESTRKIYEQTRFRFGAEERDLASLTTVHDWADSDRVSRMSFYNPRTDTIDRYSAALDVVVADGEKSFLKALSNPLFSKADVLGVFHRAIDRSDLEMVGARLVQQRQWYVDDSDLLLTLSPSPRGISLQALRARTV